MTAAESIEARLAPASFRALDANGLLWICADACLELRPARTDCHRCRDVCPAKAFEWTDEGVSLRADCTGCGMCAAACPSGALQVTGFERAAFEGAARRIECSRVPPHIARDAARVPCLGGVSGNAMLELVARTRTPWTLVDRGWCAACPAGSGAAATAASALSLVDPLLDALGVSPTRRPAIVHEPLPAGVALPQALAADAERVGRRGFFGALARAAQKATVHRIPVTSGRSGCRPSSVVQAHRRRFADAVQDLASELGGSVPASLFPRVEIASQCDGQGPCAALCPSGALRPYVDPADGSVGLQFDAKSCLACGLCARHCPSNALRLITTGPLPSGDVRGDPAVGIRTLTRHAPAVCRHCASPFVGAASAEVCPRCATERRLASSIFGTKLADEVLARPEIEMCALPQPVRQRSMS